MRPFPLDASKHSHFYCTKNCRVSQKLPSKPIAFHVNFTRSLDGEGNMTTTIEKHYSNDHFNALKRALQNELFIPEHDRNYMAYEDTLSAPCQIEALSVECGKSLLSSPNNEIERAINSVLSVPTLKGLDCMPESAETLAIVEDKTSENPPKKAEMSENGLVPSQNEETKILATESDELRGKAVHARQTLKAGELRHKETVCLPEMVPPRFVPQKNSHLPHSPLSPHAVYAQKTTVIDNSHDDLHLEEDEAAIMPTIEVTRQVLNDVKAYVERRKRDYELLDSDAETPAYLPLPRGILDKDAISSILPDRKPMRLEPRDDKDKRLDSSELSLGHIVAGRYEILSEIARGGYGIVYRARQIGIDRIVALKRLRSQNKQDVVQRFLLEANIIKNLIHPNTIQLIDAGNDEDNHLYIVMEYIEGRSLQSVLAEKEGLGLDRSVNITMQILKSLNEAHQRGIIHRDLKPSNILLRNVIGEHDFVKVLDFGIAKRSCSLVPKLTVDGKILGTPQYIAPELYTGHAPTASSDIYAIGLMLAYMITGRSLVPSNPLDAVRWHMNESSVGLPEWLRATKVGKIIIKAIEKNPAKRYQTAMEMIVDLKQLEAGTAKGSGCFGALHSHSRPKTCVFAATAISVLLAVIAGLIVLIVRT